MSGRNYADSHPVMRVSAKRFAASPFLDEYVTDEAVFGVYGGRLYPLALGADPVEDYWVLRRAAALFDVPERPMQFEGPDAVRLLNRLLTRKVDDLRPHRAGYGLACDSRGGILMDGVLIRFSPQRFWYVLADGDFLGWVRAQAEGMDVAITDPDSWVLQIQGPTSLEILEDACDGPLREFRYFAVAEVAMGGQQVIVSRTGWSGELGFEVYTLPGVDGPALWKHLIAAGAPHGLAVQSLSSLGIRRIEAGILDNGTDMTPAMTPYEAGLGKFVDLTKEDFLGRDALAAADQRPRLFGIAGPAVPVPGRSVLQDGAVVGRVTAGAWSPHLQCGIGYVVMDEPGEWLGAQVMLEDGSEASTIVELPFYDAERNIPRGLRSALDDVRSGT